MSYYDCLRRRSAILLLALFSFSLLSPVIVSAQGANVPACCRRDGKHHCSTSMSGGDSESSASFQANSKCPLYPGVVLLPASSIAAQTPPTASLAIPDNGESLPVEHRRESLRILRGSAHYKRGPPSCS